MMADEIPVDFAAGLSQAARADHEGQEDALDDITPVFIRQKFQGQDQDQRDIIDKQQGNDDGQTA